MTIITGLLCGDEMTRAKQTTTKAGERKGLGFGGRRRACRVDELVKEEAGKTGDAVVACVIMYSRRSEEEQRGQQGKHGSVARCGVGAAIGLRAAIG